MVQHNQEESVESLKISLVFFDTQAFTNVFCISEQNKAGIQTIFKCPGCFDGLSEVVPTRIGEQPSILLRV